MLIVPTECWPLVESAPRKEFTVGRKKDLRPSRCDRILGYRTLIGSSIMSPSPPLRSRNSGAATVLRKCIPAHSNVQLR
jgi:hypothetical protein